MSNTKARAKVRGTCLITGKPTSSKRTRFLPGMDARLKGMALAVVRGEKVYGSLPSGARKIWDGGEVLVGFRKKGEKLVKVGKFAMATHPRASKSKAAEKPTRRRAVRKPRAAAPAASGSEDSGAEA